MTQHQITVYFDIICAWSYIGHRTLFQAIDLFQKTYPGARYDDYDITWRPYYRDRSLPDIGVPLEERLESALGSDGLSKTKTRVVRMGRNYGINFVFTSNVGNTRSCHRLVYAVGISHGSEMQRELIQEMYFRWHEVGADITSNRFLSECAKSVGFPESEAMEVLESGRYAEEVDQLDSDGRASGNSCVPTFVVNGTRIEGAEDVSTLYELLVKAKDADVERSG